MNYIEMVLAWKDYCSLIFEDGFAPVIASQIVAVRISNGVYSSNCGV